MPDNNTTPQKTTGSGAKVSISTDGTTFQEFGSVSSVSMPTMSRGTVDVTDLNSYEDNDKFKEYLADFVEGGDLVTNGFFLAGDEGQAAAETAFYGDNPVWIRIVLPAKIGKTFTAKGIPTSYQPLGDIDPSNGIGFSFTVKVTAKPTLAATTQGG